VFYLKRLGKVLHLSSSRKLILRTKVKVKIGTEALGVKRNPIGTIFDIFGPVGNPYVSIKPSITDPDRYIGRIFYILSTQGK